MSETQPDNTIIMRFSKQVIIPDYHLFEENIIANISGPLEPYSFKIELIYPTESTNFTQGINHITGKVRNSSNVF